MTALQAGETGKAIGLHLLLELVVRNRSLIATLGDNSQIVEVFEQFFVVGDRENDRDLFALFVSQELDRFAHGFNVSVHVRAGEAKPAACSRASARMRPTIANRPFLRVGLRCLSRPSLVSVLFASAARISSGVRPLKIIWSTAIRPRTMKASLSARMRTAPGRSGSGSRIIHTIAWQPWTRCSSDFSASDKPASFLPRSIR